jgi:hypothetical protein
MEPFQQREVPKDRETTRQGFWRPGEDDRLSKFYGWYLIITVYISIQTQSLSWTTTATQMSGQNTAEVKYLAGT